MNINYKLVGSIVGGVAVVAASVAAYFKFKGGKSETPAPAAA